jgi:DUF1009 family protein
VSEKDRLVTVELLKAVMNQQADADSVLFQDFIKEFQRLGAKVMRLEARVKKLEEKGD